MKSRISLSYLLLAAVAFFSVESAVFAFPEASPEAGIKQGADQVQSQTNGVIPWEELTVFNSDYAVSDENRTLSGEAYIHISSVAFIKTQQGIASNLAQPRDSRQRLTHQIYPFHFFW